MANQEDKRAQKFQWVKEKLEEMRKEWNKKFPGETKRGLHYVIFNSLNWE